MMNHIILIRMPIWIRIIIRKHKINLLSHTKRVHAVGKFNSVRKIGERQMETTSQISPSRHTKKEFSAFTGYYYWI